MSGVSIPAGNGVLVELDIDPITNETPCLTEIIISDEDADQLLNCDDEVCQ